MIYNPALLKHHMLGWQPNVSPVGIDPALLPDHVKTKISPRDRKAVLGKHGWTKAEQLEKNANQSEKELQDQIAGYLSQNGVYYTRSRMDKRTTNRMGTPDFLCCVPSGNQGVFLAIECKAKDRRPTKEQAEEMWAISRSYGRTLLAYNIESVQSAIQEIKREGWKVK